MGETDGPGSLMIIRAWVEAGSTQPLRVRVRTGSAPDADDHYLADPKAVGELVENWLAGLIAEAT